MPRFYFNLRHAHLHVPDADGCDCASPREAIELAAVAALDRITGGSRARNWARWSVEIEDQERRQVATLPFTLVLRARAPHSE